jgi:hypothetical protein
MPDSARLVFQSGGLCKRRPVVRLVKAVCVILTNGNRRPALVPLLDPSFRFQGSNRDPIFSSASTMLVWRESPSRIHPDARPYKQVEGRTAARHIEGRCDSIAGVILAIASRPRRDGHITSRIREHSTASDLQTVKTYCCTVPQPGYLVHGRC